MALTNWQTGAQNERVCGIEVVWFCFDFWFNFSFGFGSDINLMVIATVNYRVVVLLILDFSEVLVSHESMVITLYIFIIWW